MTASDVTHPRAAELIQTLELSLHPEGFYREVFRSDEVVRPADHRGERSALTTIYFLLTSDSVVVKCRPQSLLRS